MNTIPRRSILGLVALSAGVAGARSTGAANSAAGEYSGQSGAIAAIGLGRGQAVSVSVVWLPLGGTSDERSSREAELVIYDLGGRALVRKKVELTPFTGASVEWELPRGMRRQSVFGYTVIGEPFEDVYATLEVFDVASGQTIHAMVDPTG